MSTFGERLHDAMKLGAVSVNTVANLCRVSRQTVNKWFHMDEADLSAKHLVQVATFLQVRTNWLVFGRMPMYRVLEIRAQEEHIT